MKLAEYVAAFLSQHTNRVFGVCGGGAMHLNDAIAHYPGLQFVAMHHEQAAAYAAEGYARVSGKIGVVHVTAGCGGTNAMTGMACAWVDSIPMLVISGQVGTTTLSQGEVRQLGCNELNTLDMVRPITKHAVRVSKSDDIRYELERAVHLATSGRPGPVWVEIPLDVQAADVDMDALSVSRYEPCETPELTLQELRKGGVATEVADCLYRAERPLLLIGNGVRLAGAQNELITFLSRWRIPVVSSWNASDLLPTESPLYVGRCGIIGDRAGNFAAQNADVILAIGTRLSIPQIGHATQLFAPNAELIVVDIDAAEAWKSTSSADIRIAADAGIFLSEMNRLPATAPRERWAARCLDWKAKYPVIPPCHGDIGINPYAFVDVLGKHIANDAVVATDVGMAFICTMQALRLSGSQRLFHSSGVAPMGYGLPAAIGACMHGGASQYVCIAGDGGLMFNLQELQTVRNYQLPLKLFILCNNGYRTIQTTQNHHFKRESVATPQSGVTFPDFGKIVAAFGFDYFQTHSRAEMNEIVPHVLDMPSASVAVLHLMDDAVVSPRVQSRMENGKFVPTPIEDMWPHLPSDELARNMMPENRMAYS